MPPLRPSWLAGLILGLGLTSLASIGCAGDDVRVISGPRSELIAQANDTVTALAFAPDGRLFLTEQNSGKVRIITAQGQLLPEPFAQVDVAHPAVASGLEWGLLGLALDPEFEDNHYVYIYFIQPAETEPNPPRPVLMRFTDVDNEGVDPTVLIEFPEANPEVAGQVGGGIHFGPDGYLYISIGDKGREELSQDLSSPFGKILRVTRDGDPAPDNPFLDEPDADPRVYAYGLRNTFAFTFDPETGRIYAADIGDTNCDELNIIEAGENYGWPQSFDVSGAPCQNPGAVEPIYNYARPGKQPEAPDSNVIPTGVQFVSGEVYPALGDRLLVCEHETRLMRRLQLAGLKKDQVTDGSVVVKNCAVALTVDPGGIVYYSIGNEVRRLPPQLFGSSASHR